MKITIKADNEGSKFRGYTALVFTVISLILAVVLFIFLLTHGENFGSALIAGIVLGAFLGGMIPGLTYHRSVHAKIHKTLYIPPIGWAIYLNLIIFMTFGAGWFYMLRDLKKYVKIEKGE